MLVEDSISSIITTTPGTVNSGQDLEATHLAAAKHAGESRTPLRATIISGDSTKNVAIAYVRHENPQRVTGSPRSTPIAAIPKQGCEGRTPSRATNQRRLHHKTPPEPREESLEARELCCRRCSTAKVLPILGPLPALYETVEPPSTIHHPELSRPLPVPDIDKSWITKPRGSVEYRDGLNRFLDFTFANSSSDGMIHCPCPLCGFRFFQTREDAYDHLLMKPFPPNYTFWLHHGERIVDERPNGREELEPTVNLGDQICDMVHDAFNLPGLQSDNEDSINGHVGNVAEGLLFISDEPSREARAFHDLLEDGEQELYPGCSKFSKLSFLVRLYHIKCMCRVSDKAFGLILELLGDAFEHAVIPKTLHDAKRIIRKLGIEYKKIDACPNDCMLYQGSDQDLSRCKQCGASRWKQKTRKNSVVRINAVVKKNGKPLPAKILRYFPLIPRLQRLFMSSKTSVDMLWHKRRTNSDGSLRHPRDGEAWKAFDRRYTDFSGDPRSVRLALASDSFNPYENLSSKYSIWPVILIPYNLPPWICMKQTNFILSMIIPGPKMPGNDIDVYLQPLIDELKQLWAGVDTYDASEKKTCKMRAALMWTISDFPGLGNLSGWNTYGGRACPTCNLDIETRRLTFSQKWCFMGHRRFLNHDHRYRQDRIRFDGKLEGVPVSHGKVQAVGGKRRRVQQTGVQDESPWKKRSIFFDLPYWENNELRHNLDVMHIEKNVCDNIVFTMLNESGKFKDHLKARKDLQLMGIRYDMWPLEGGKYPSAVFTMSNPQKEVFLRTIKNVVFPDGYSSNISRCVDLKQRKLSGLKSHDCHILMEHLLPIALRHVLPTQVSAVLAQLSAFFRLLCSKCIDPRQLPLLQDRVVHTLCHMEMIFPPSFFTVMVHLTVHLVEEARLGGPVHYRWMYPIERYLCRLKQYVRNRAQPEGSIAEGYLSEEILTFCSRYLDNVETRINRPSRVDDRLSDALPSEAASMFPEVGKAVGAASFFTLTPTEIL
ncbi:uncharacterized protein LOC107493943 [Arachis duranensis]|uniref:Uncharacterized protein LOC107493943 n=1 Tax=Arachis duranensis TaxID=130453 RepID=A0A9C6U0G1_ARADU|nr:uncharacterized protein LOC107493943 [Arachis duranensis]